MPETAPENESNPSTVDPASALETDSLGRPVLPVHQDHLDALEKGYRGHDGADLGAAVHPEDVGTFEENAARVGQPAHSEAVVIEVPGGKTETGYTAFNAPNVPAGSPAPVEGGDATKADKPKS